MQRDTDGIAATIGRGAAVLSALVGLVLPLLAVGCGGDDVGVAVDVRPPPASEVVGAASLGAG